MSHHRNTGKESNGPVIYELRIEGHLGSHWTGWFGGMTITLEDNGDSLFTGPVEDQAALHGMLRTVRDLGLILVSVLRVTTDRTVAMKEK